MGSPQSNVLRILHNALHEFNYSKKLRRPPLLLTGGLNAWVNIFGHTSLKTEEAPAPFVPSMHRRSQQVVRVPTPLLLECRSQNPPPYPTLENGVTSQAVTMPAEPGPINIEEEKVWMEQLRKENEYGSVSTMDGNTKRRRTSLTPNSAGGAVFARTVEEYVKLPVYSTTAKANTNSSSNNTQEVHTDRRA